MIRMDMTAVAPASMPGVQNKVESDKATPPESSASHTSAHGLGEFSFKYHIERVFVSMFE
jgi:hypothetical protein